MTFPTSLILLTSLNVPVSTFLAYDCSGAHSGEPLQFGQFDLTKVFGSCEESLRAQYENITNQRVQVLKFIPNPVIELNNCIVKADLYIGNCGSGFFTTMTHELKTVYKSKHYPLSRDDCNTAIRDDRWNLYLHGKNISLNSKGDGVVFPIYLYGSQRDDSGCKGQSFTFANKKHTRGILKVEVTLISSKLSGHLSSNLSEIYVRDKVILDAALGYGYDSKEGSFTWNTTSIPSNTCERFKTVFAGVGDYYRPKDDSSHLKALLKARSKDEKHSATLKLEYKTSLCGREAFRTNLDNIYVLLHGPFNKHLYTDLDTQAINNTDVDLYENILAIANGNYFTTQIVLDTSFASMSSDICRQEEINALQSLTDWEKAGSGLIKPGHVKGLLAKTYGESGVLFICNPIEANIRRSTNCCKELPITVSGSTSELFMEPLTHKITSHCTRIPCSDTIKNLWELDGQWFSINSKGNAHISAPPDVIQLGNSTYMERVWRYNLDVGIYSKEQLQSLRKSQEIGKARTASNDQLHRVLQGSLSDDELTAFAEEIPDAIINSIQDQVLSPGMLFLNKGFWVIKILVSMGLIGAIILALIKCYVRAKFVRSISEPSLNICDKISATLSTIGIVSKKLYTSKPQCSCTPDIEALHDDIRSIKIQIDEVFYVLEKLKRPPPITAPTKIAPESDSA